MVELFETGHSFIFYHYYGGDLGLQQFSGQVVAYEHPLVRVETEGLIRIVNCASQHFVEAIARRKAEELEALEFEKKSGANS